MDEFVEKSRSNYFRVKSGSEFEKLCEKWGLEILYGESGIRAGKFGFIISDGYRQKGRSIHKFKKPSRNYWKRKKSVLSEPLPMNGIQ